MEQLQARALKKLESEEVPASGLSLAPQSQHRGAQNPQDSGAYFSGSHHRQATFMFFILAQWTTCAQQQYQGTESKLVMCAQVIHIHGLVKISGWNTEMCLFNLSNVEDKWDPKTVPGDLNWVIHMHTNDP